ncbi:MAG: IS66 family insertion sequence element accessory protein TnpB [Halorhodospira sp.]
MITLPRSAPIHLALEPVDFRKSFNGLSIAVLEALGRDPLSGELFVFRNRGGDKLKALYWDGQGFVVLYKRLEQGRFVWPRSGQGSLPLSTAQLQALFEGADWRALRRLPDYPAKAVA